MSKDEKGSSGWILTTYRSDVSLRDWFAGMALQGYISREISARDHTDPEIAARRAYNYADAMLAERVK